MCGDSRIIVVLKNKTQFFAQERTWKENVCCGYFWVGHCAACFLSFRFPAFLSDGLISLLEIHIN